MSRVVAGLVAIVLHYQPALPRSEAVTWARGVVVASERFDIDPELIAAVVTLESRWRPNLVTPNHGGCAVGLIQYQIPVRGICGPCLRGISHCPDRVRRMLVPRRNLAGGASILASKRRIAASRGIRPFWALYNWGQPRYVTWIETSLARVRRYTR